MWLAQFPAYDVFLLLEKGWAQKCNLLYAGEVCLSYSCLSHLLQQ
jgi:hypothetical protein